MTPVPSEAPEFLKIVEQKDDTHDLIDDHVLYAVYRDAVDFLVS